MNSYPPLNDEFLLAAYSWSKGNVSRIWWGQGQHSGSFVPVFEEGSLKQLLFALFTGGLKSKPTLQLYFAYWAKHPPFESVSARLEMLRRLNEIPGIRLPESAVEKWPTVQFETIANDASIEKLISVMEWFVAEAKRAATSESQTEPPSVTLPAA